MPFTLAHPVGALPLKWVKRSLFSTTGLVVGSMAPDYEYFLKQYPSPTIGETTFGVFFFDFPLAILVALVFHLLVKQPLIRHLPQPFDLRYSGYAQSPFLSYLGKHWLVFLTSILIGIGTHLLLDWVTHPIHGPLAKTSITAVTNIGPLRTRPLIVAERTFDVVGTALLFLLILRLKKPSACYSKVLSMNKWVFWFLFTAITAAVMIWEWQEAGGFAGTGIFVTVLIWALTVGLVTASVLIKLLERFQQK